MSFQTRSRENVDHLSRKYLSSVSRTQRLFRNGYSTGKLVNHFEECGSIISSRIIIRCPDLSFEHESIRISNYYFCWRSVCSPRARIYADRQSASRVSLFLVILLYNIPFKQTVTVELMLRDFLPSAVRRSTEQPTARRAVYESCLFCCRRRRVREKYHRKTNEVSSHVSSQIYSTQHLQII